MASERLCAAPSAKWRTAAATLTFSRGLFTDLLVDPASAVHSEGISLSALIRQIDPRPAMPDVWAEASRSDEAPPGGVRKTGRACARRGGGGRQQTGGWPAPRPAPSRPVPSRPVACLVADATTLWTVEPCRTENRSVVFMCFQETRCKETELSQSDIDTWRIDLYGSRNCVRRPWWYSRGQK